MKQQKKTRGKKNSDRIGVGQFARPAIDYSQAIASLILNPTILQPMETINLAVNGTLMQGLELNQNLLKIGAKFVKEARTEPSYRLWSIGDRYPAMQRVKMGGTRIAVEIWAVPMVGLAAILLQEPPGLCIGKVRLDTGEEVLGVVGEAIACEGNKEITKYGGWRNYMQSLFS